MRLTGGGATTVASELVLLSSESVESGWMLCFFFFFEGFSESESISAASADSELAFLDCLCWAVPEVGAAMLRELERSSGFAVPTRRRFAAAASFSSWAFMRACLPERPPHLRRKGRK